MDAGASARCRRPADQQHRRYHELRAARARTTDARVRLHEARWRRDSRQGRAAGRGAAHTGWSDAHAHARDAGHCRCGACRRDRRGDGRDRQRSERRDSDHRLRECVLHPTAGASHEQSPWNEDGSEHAVRARDRSAVARDRHGAGVCATRACSCRSGPRHARRSLPAAPRTGGAAAASRPHHWTPGHNRA